MKVTGDISAVIHTSGQLQERKWKIIISERPHCKKWVKSPILANKNRTDCFLFVFSHTCLNFTLFKSFIGNESIYYGSVAVEEPACPHLNQRLWFQLWQKTDDTFPSHSVEMLWPHPLGFWFLLQWTRLFPQSLTGSRTGAENKPRNETKLSNSPRPLANNCFPSESPTSDTFHVQLCRMRNVF